MLSAQAPRSNSYEPQVHTEPLCDLGGPGSLSGPQWPHSQGGLAPSAQGFTPRSSGSRHRDGGSHTKLDIDRHRGTHSESQESRSQFLPALAPAQEAGPDGGVRRRCPLPQPYWALRCPLPRDLGGNSGRPLVLNRTLPQEPRPHTEAAPALSQLQGHRSGRPAAGTGRPWRHLAAHCRHGETEAGARDHWSLVHAPPWGHGRASPGEVGLHLGSYQETHMRPKVHEEPSGPQFPPVQTATAPQHQ